MGGADELEEPLFGALFSLPTSTGAVIDWTEAIERVHEHRGIAAITTDPSRGFPGRRIGCPVRANGVPASS